MSRLHQVDAPRRLAAFVAIALAITSAGALTHPTSTFAWGNNAYSSADEHELVALTNQSRAAAGRKSLKISSTLTSIARWRSKDMITRGYFSHSIPGVGNVFDTMDSKGYCYHLAGENIGWNNASDASATPTIHQMFMGSSTHRSNILGKTWDVIGVGAYQGSDGKKMFTVLFADRAGCGSSTPAPKPTAKPAPTPPSNATTRPTAKPTPTPAPTVDPAVDVDPSVGPGATDEPLPVASDEPSDFPTPLPFPSDDPTDPDAVPSDDGADGGDASDDPGAVEAPTADHGLRVLAASTTPGLLDTIVGGVTGFFFGG